MAALVLRPPPHRLALWPFAVACAPVTLAEFAAFVADDGYRRPELWGPAAIPLGTLDKMA
jgi:formylglycine-generating enzyme required for sulfatase activity